MPTAKNRKSLEKRFLGLAEAWRAGRGPTSSIEKISMHAAYQQIIGIGPDAIPLILQELERQPDHWFWALWAITGDDPIPEEARGNLKKMTEAWLEWGRKHGYRWSHVATRPVVSKPRNSGLRRHEQGVG